MDKISPEVSLSGKTVIVTGSSAGIGICTAKEMARRGARVIMACRNKEKTEPVREEIIRDTGNENVVFMQLDLSSLQSVRDFAAEYNNSESRLDILINNAAVTATNRLTTKDGFELMFGTNHLGHFLLTNLLLDKLKASAPSRVVTVASIAHTDAALDFNDLQSERNYGMGADAYGKSKTANVMFSVHLAKLLEGTGVTTYSLHPGVILSTSLARDVPCHGNCCFVCLMSIFAKCKYSESTKSLEEGALTTIYAALEPSIAQHSGRYYQDCKEKPAAVFATNEADCERLWNVSKELVSL